MHQIFPDQAAENDLDGIFEWYEEQRKNLGYEFLLMFDECVTALERNPFHTFNVTRQVRLLPSPAFPTMYITQFATIKFIFM